MLRNVSVNTRMLLSALFPFSTGGMNRSFSRGRGGNFGKLSAMPFLLFRDMSTTFSIKISWSSSSSCPGGGIIMLVLMTSLLVFCTDMEKILVNLPRYSENPMLEQCQSLDSHAFIFHLSNY